MIRIRNLTKDYLVNGKSFGAVNGIDLEIRDGEFFTLLGPSGCGKSTLLRCIAGLETPIGGEIEVNGTVVFSAARGINVAPNRRKMGMVFQSYAVWPHMTVGQNVAFPLEVQKLDRKAERVSNALALVGLEQFATRPAFRLSGGQQQRVALARAIVASPTILLLDEPLSNLDAALRGQMRTELARLHHSLGLTTIFVTHDQDEALSLSQSIAVMDGGKIVEVASPEALYRSPKSLFSAEFLGAANIYTAKVLPDPTKALRLETSFGILHAATGAAVHLTIRDGDVLSLYLRPEKIRVGKSPSADEPNQFSGRIVTRGFLGHNVDLTVALADQSLLRCLCESAEVLAVGDEVTVSVQPSDVGIAEDARRVRMLSLA